MECIWLSCNRHKVSRWLLYFISSQIVYKFDKIMIIFSPEITSCKLFLSKSLAFVLIYWTKRCLLYVQTIRQNGYKHDPIAKEFGISIDDKLATVEARVLPAPWVTTDIPELLWLGFIITKRLFICFFVFVSWSTMIQGRKRNVIHS